MRRIPAIDDGLIFSGCMLTGAIISLIFSSVQTAMWSTFSTLYAFLLFNAAKDYKNHFYTAFWLLVIVFSIYLGNALRLGDPFYLFLIIFSFIYYQIYGSDPVIDLSMKFIIIMSTIGTAIPNISIDLPIGFFIGSSITIFVCNYLSNKAHKKINFGNSQVEKNLFTLRKNILPRSLIYVSGLLLTLYIPRLLDFGHFYWTLLTFVFVLHPKSNSIISLTSQRVLGSILAVLCLYLLFNTPLMPYIGVISILVFAFLYPMSGHKNYTFMTFITTCLILSIIEQVEYWRHPAYILFFDRVLETCLGGTIAIVTSICLKHYRTE